MIYPMTVAFKLRQQLGALSRTKHVGNTICNVHTLIISKTAFLLLGIRLFIISPLEVVLLGAHCASIFLSAVLCIFSYAEIVIVLRSCHYK